MKKVSIVIGLYNSANTITQVIKEIELTFCDLNNYKIELVLVDDHSPDNVYEIVKNIAIEKKWIKVIHLAKNAGQTNAVIEGYKYASGDYIVEMDDDLQMPPKAIPEMIELIEKGNYDVVFAKYKHQKENLFRRIGSLINNRMAEIMVGKPKGIRVNSFLCMRRFIAEVCVRYANNYPYLYGIIFATTNNVANIEVEHRPRLYGKSNYTFKKLLSLWMNGFLNFSVEPLRMLIRVGGVIVFFSAIVSIYLIIQRIFGGTRSLGWTSIILTIIVFSGFQLIGIGMLGEYIGRMYISNSNLPRVTVKETLNINPDENNA